MEAGRGQDHRGERGVSDLIFLAANTVPIWTRAAVALLALLVIGLVFYVATDQ